MKPNDELQKLEPIFKQMRRYAIENPVAYAEDFDLQKTVRAVTPEISVGLSLNK